MRRLASSRGLRVCRCVAGRCSSPVDGSRAAVGERSSSAASSRGARTRAFATTVQRRRARQQPRLPGVRHRGLRRRHRRRRVPASVSASCFDAGLGVGYLQRSTVPSVYADFVNDERRGDRAGPASCASCRSRRRSGSCRSADRAASSRTSAPASASSTGATRETGEFVDFSDDEHLPRQLRRSGHGDRAGRFSAACRFPIGPLGVGGEVRYQNADGDLPVDQDFAADKIDLGGCTYLATFNVRF